MLAPDRHVNADSHRPAVGSPLIISITDDQATLEGATRAVDEAERRFLGPLPDDEAAAFRDSLRTAALAPGVTAG